MFTVCFQHIQQCSVYSLLPKHSTVPQCASYTCNSTVCLQPASYTCNSAECLQPASYTCNSAVCLQSASHTCNSAVCLQSASHTCNNAVCLQSASQTCNSAVCLQSASLTCNSAVCLQSASQTCVTAVGNFMIWPSVFPMIPAESGSLSLRTGSARPCLVVNRILICSGGLGLPHQQGWGSCSSVLSTLLTSTTVFATSTKH